MSPQANKEDSLTASFTPYQQGKGEEYMSLA